MEGSEDMKAPLPEGIHIHLISKLNENVKHQKED
jgi:hypothetical protein